MRIIQALGWYHPESLGGTEVYVAGLCQRLLTAGHEVHVAAPDARQPLERTYHHDGVPVYRYPIPAQPTRQECQGLAPVPGSERFHTWLARRRPDVVHLHTFVTGLGLSEVKAAKATGARVIVTTHASSLGYVCQRGTMMRWGERLCDGICQPAKCAACSLQQRGLSRTTARIVGGLPPGLGRFAGALPGRVGTSLGMSHLIAQNQARQRELLATVDRFVLLTRWAMEAVAANGAPPEKLALNRLGISQADVTPKPGPDTRPTRPPITVGYLGRLDPNKGVHDLARAATSLPRDLPIRVEFRSPGLDPTEREVKAELQALVGDDPRVLFATPARPSEVLQVLAGYDVLCCPAACLEGGPTVAIEAHAVGTPVIGTRIGGLAEMVPDELDGRLVPPGDWRALAHVLRTMAADPTGTIDRWRRALPSVRTMDEIAADYLALYAA